MNQTLFQKNNLIRWSFGLSALSLAFLAVFSGAGLFSFLKANPDNLRGSLGSSLQKIDIKPSGENNVFTTSSGVALTKGLLGYEKTRRVESDTIVATNDFIAVGFRWHESVPLGTTLNISYRVGNDQGYSSWRRVLPSDDVHIKNDPQALASDLLFVTKSKQVQVAIDLSTDNRKITPRLDDLRLDFINSLAGPSAAIAVNNLSTIRADAATVGSPNIISRAGWGANEQWMTWTPEYATVKQIIVHHTAGSDGGNDSAAVVRGIYYYHANTLGWGDIGYNYLIDAQGRIYRGRAGGDKVIGGHAYGYNTGSIGIALLGTYESKAATPAAEAALADLAGYLSARFNLAPNQKHTFIDKNAYALAGHRDFNSTLCPGTTEHSRLPSIRIKAATAKNNYIAGNYAAGLSGITGNILLPNRSGTAVIKIKNTGKKIWYRGGSFGVRLRTAGPLNHNSRLYDAKWRSKSEPSLMEQGQVAPGQVATFKVPLKAAGVGNTSDNFVLLVGGNTTIPGSNFTLTRSVRAPYAGQVVGLPSVINVGGGERVSITIKIKNTGYYTWKNSGSNFAALNLIDPLGRTSNLRAADWPLSYRPTLMDTSVVKPDQTAAFTFNLKMPSRVGDYYEPMQAVIEKKQFIPGTAFKLHLRVTNKYQARISEHPLEVYGSANQVIKTKVTVTNLSSFSWQPSGAGAVSLKALGNNPAALSAGWLNGSTVTALPKKIAPGQSTVVDFSLKMPSKYGASDQYFELQSGGNKIDGSKFKLRLVVRRDYEAKVLSTTPLVKLKAGGKGRATVRIQNKGSKTWRAAGAKLVQVVTNNSWKHASGFKTGSWNNSYSPTNLEPKVVAPNQVATLSIEIAAGNKNGRSTEYFGLAEPDGTPMVYSGFAITREVTGAKSGGGVAGNSIIRAGIYSTTSSITVSGTSYRVSDTKGRVIKNTAKGVTRVAWTGSGYKVSGAAVGSSKYPIMFSPHGSTILSLPGFSNRPAWNPKLNDNAFRGRIEVRHNSDNKLYAINHVALEYYLRGIAEASNNDYPEYLKALMIAVRTYAEYHRQNGGKHSSLGYDLSNTDQVYRGYNFEKRAGKIVAAVTATTGQFVFYHGKIVVTPYFSQSDGHTRSFSQVFGGPNKPWLVSVSVPEDKNLPLKGHGVGMSARAARLRAAKGQKADTILKSFYTQVTIRDLY